MRNLLLKKQGKGQLMIHLRFLAMLSVMLIFTISGCGGKATSQSFVRDDVDLGFITRVAVFPFVNNTDDKFAAERAGNIVTTQILHSRIFDVVDMGLVSSALRDEAIDDISLIDTATMSRLGQRLNVQAFILGSVDHSSQIRRGTIVYPEISMTLRLVDAKASLVLWQANGQRNGDSVMGRLFGLPPSDAYQITLHLAGDLLETIPGE